MRALLRVRDELDERIAEDRKSEAFHSPYSASHGLRIARGMVDEIITEYECLSLRDAGYSE
jgi:hypothetical protein